MKRYCLVLVFLFTFMQVLVPGLQTTATTIVNELNNENIINEEVNEKLEINSEDKNVDEVGQEVNDESSLGSKVEIPTETEEEKNDLEEEISIEEIVDDKAEVLEENHEEVNENEVYEKVKRSIPSLYSVSDYDLNMEKEEYRMDIEALNEIEYLVPKTKENFEIVYAHSDGNFTYVDNAKTIEEGIAKINNLITPMSSDEIIPSIIDSNGVIVYSTNAMGRLLKHINGNPYYGININTDLYTTSSLSYASGYINQGYVDDVPVIQDTGNAAQIQVSGQIAWVNKNTSKTEYDLIIVPLNQVYNPSYYESVNGELVHWISTNVTDKNKKSGSKRAIGVAPNWMVEGQKYYSYDGNYFYNTLNELITDLKNNTKVYAVNKNNKYYNYYLYLPFRSKTTYTATDINNFINANVNSSEKTGLRNSGQAFINAQNKYGVNAAIMLGIAINESGWGKSDYAVNRNNLFGLGAFDSDPDNAYGFRSIDHCIDEFANYWISKGYSDPQDTRYYGGFTGNKKFGANVKYASDPFWGEKAASNAFLLDKTISGSITKLRDYNNYQIAIYTNPVMVKNSAGNTLYEVRSTLDFNVAFVGTPVIITNSSKIQISGKDCYEIYPERTTSLPSTGGSEFIGSYDWNIRGYIEANSVEFINTPNLKSGINYQVDIRNSGWTSWNNNGSVAGTTGTGKTIEQIKIQLSDMPLGSNVKYRVYVNGVGWQEWNSDGSIAGISGKAIDAVQIIGSFGDGKTIEYRTYNKYDGWLPWQKAGDVSGKIGRGIEAIQIRVINAANQTTLKAGTYEENNSCIQQLGDWIENKESGYSNGAAIYTNSSGSAIEFTFEGTGFKLFGLANKYKGIGKIIIDGKLENNFDSYTKDDIYKNLMFQRTDLDYGKHTVRIEVTGLKNENSSGAHINIDYIEIVGNENQTTKLVQDNNINVKYTGTWTNWTNSYLSGGTAKYSNGVNNSVEYTFNGTGIRILGYTNIEKGFAKVYIDGKEYSIDAYTEANVYKNNIFEITGLKSGNHTIKLVVTGKKNSKAIASYINFDAFEVINPGISSVLSAGRYEESDLRFDYYGDWSKDSHVSNSGGYALFSNKVGSAIEFTFVGTGFNLYTYKNKFKGIAQVTIDGKVVNNIDAFSSTDSYNSKAYSRTDLEYGTHTVKIEVTSLKNPSSSGTYLNIDAIEIVDSRNKETKLVDDTSSEIKYSSNWISDDNPNYSGGSSKYTNKANSYVEYTFNGTGVRVLGYTNIYKGLAKIYVDGKEYLIDSYTKADIYKNNIFEITGLTKGKHTIKIVVTGNKNGSSSGAHINIDAFEVIEPVMQTALTVGRYEEDNKNIDYYGNWIKDINSKNSGGTALFSNEKGAFVEFTFEGTGFNLYTLSNIYKGIAKVTIDGKAINNIDAYSKTDSYNNFVYGKTDLSYGKHTVRIEVTGLKNPSASGVYLNIDAIEILDTRNLEVEIIDETDNKITYYGNWFNDINSNNLRGTAKYINVANSYIEYTFKGSGIRVIGYTNVYKGLAKVYVDGKEYSIDSYTKENIYKNNIFEINGLERKEHTIKIVVTGNKNSESLGAHINIDGFEIIEPIDDNALMPGRYEEDNSKIDYVGNWQTDIDARNSSGSAKFSNHKGAYLEFTFEGTGFNLYGYSNIYKGIASVTIDGKKVNNFDSYTNGDQYMNRVYSKTDLPYGKHKVKVEITGMKNNISSGLHLNIDFIEIVGKSSNIIKTVEDTDSEVKFSGNWILAKDSRYSGGSTKYINLANSSIEYTFNGTGIRVLGHTNVYKGFGKVFIDGKEYAIDSYTEEDIYQNNIFEITGLSKGNHTIKIVVTGNKNDNSLREHLNFDAFQVLE